MNPWKADDEATQALMTTFYSEWLRTGDIRPEWIQGSTAKDLDDAEGVCLALLLGRVCHGWGAESCSEKPPISGKAEEGL
jgi:hypothetical protein